MGVKERMVQVREAFGVNQRQMAKRIGVSSQLISQVENEKIALSHLTAKAIEAEFGVNHDWLMTGEGEMVTKKKNATKPVALSDKLITALAYYPRVAEMLNSLSDRMTLADWEALNAFASRSTQEQSEGCADDLSP